jgi:hypothetical protein
VESLSEDVRAVLLGLEPGQVSAPQSLVEDGRTVWQVFRLVARLPARDVPYAEAAEEIEKGLARRPRETWEYEEWAQRARARHRIEWKIR